MKKIAVFTSGGDAPGMNACIRSVVRSALYHELEIYGIKYGYNGMIEGDIYKMKSYSVSNIVQRGGTILKSARSKEFMTKEGRKKAYEQLSSRGIEGLIAIGGDGTFTGANIFFEEYGIPVVGAPGTIDNDLFGSDYTIGFDTAVNTALEAIDKIRDTAMSHDRVFFIEVMGRHSGYIAIQSGIGGGAEMVMVPETSTTINEVINTLQKGKDAQKTSSIVVVAEGGEEGNAHEIAAKVAPHLPKADIRVSTLGHIQRGGNPTAFDRILASRLGLAAVEGLLNGEKNVMVGIIDKEVVYTNLKIAISKSKPLDQDLIRLVEILSI
ncbi:MULTISPECIES: 6-phosphofructokinase [unclassified Imperialibacter]|jgi:6-phosphofructokinase 1|uniref:6-phosphofructokinase n=1 Tax=unclassified Imperialibacter TaxID=2629706 RepID=UPI001254946E|nr:MULTISPECIES: 6-phosphofructokinase [unclassified Imperialibacter]CAD5299281.1 ATP-dependent 6-phosphofructokinase [Imperialibacter sp. 89]CAD5299873.1 ATP-dependent 6-phosphofructokinase [Imperialibacter sp. 75]VVT20667.1 ATP-dependent 6-phosphofructokinase [Imperialibacter sp. EC-SDR9]